MLVALLAATAVPVAPERAWRPRGEAVRQATVSVRIVSGARIAEGKVPDTAMVGETRVRGADGVQRTARLVEFP